MMTRMNLLLIAVAVLTTVGCATYADQPALKFRDYDYSGPDGKAWPAQDLALPEIQRMYAMNTAPTVHIVELNPKAKKTLVFVHGLGSYLKFWRYNLDHFAAQGYRVIALDQIGYGKSDKPASFPYTMEAMADVVKAVIDRLEADKPIVIGHSMGGQTALSLAIRYPEAISGLVLASPAGFEAFSEQEERWYRQAVRTIHVRASDEAAIWGSIRHANFFRWRDDYAWLVEERVRVKQDPAFAQYAYANVRSIQGLADNDFVRDNLQHVKAPTAIIFGERDRLIPSPFFHGGFTRDVMQYGADTIPDATLVPLADCGHTVQMDCSAGFNDAMTAWLKPRFAADGKPAPMPTTPAGPDAPHPEAPKTPAPEAPKTPAPEAPTTPAPEAAAPEASNP